MVMRTNGSVATGLQATHMIFTIVFCIVQIDSVECSFFLWHYWSLFENAEGHTVTVNAEGSIVMLDTFLHNDLHPHQQDWLWLQQDGATAHTM
jgi:hypothetical protein